MTQPKTEHELIESILRTATRTRVIETIATRKPDELPAPARVAADNMAAMIVAVEMSLSMSGVGEVQLLAQTDTYYRDTRPSRENNRLVRLAQRIGGRR